MADVTPDDDLAASPAIFPFAIDQRADMVLLIRMTKDDYDAASFLDKRMLKPGAAGTWRPWGDVCRAAAGLPERCNFIFHISHVGSTLLSRLLGQHPSLFSLREPLILRTLAETYCALEQAGCIWTRDEFPDRLGAFLSLWSRTFAAEQTALIKATSFVSEIAELLLGRINSARAIFMNVSPSIFLKALLDGAMSDVNDQAESRLNRLHRRLGFAPWQVDKLSAGECVAMSWLCEMLALHAASRRFPERVLWIDFDRFLDAPEMSLASAIGHLGFDARNDILQAILRGPEMHRYAKAPAYAFDATTRAQLLRQSENRHVLEIRKGLDWLERAAVTIPAARQVIEAATRVGQFATAYTSS
jgi:hypothetical protein